jgi:hypothetical protein
MRLQSEIAGCLRIGLQRAGKRFTWQFWNTGSFTELTQKTQPSSTIHRFSPIVQKINLRGFGRC